MGITLFAFDANEEISAHTSTGDAMVLVLEISAGNISGQSHTVQAGEVIIMPAGQPHSVHAQRRFKMLLTVVFPAPKTPA